MKGKLLVFEGIDASGKATQCRLLEEFLSQRGVDLRHVSFPDYQSASSGPAQMYLNGEIRQDPAEINPYAASSLFAADRYISYMRDWKADYDAGRTILCDRYTTSNITHQMEKLPRGEWDGFIDWLCGFEYGLLTLPKPDMVFYLDIPAQVSQSLLERRYSGNNDKKDFHERDAAYLARCRQAALYAAPKLGWKVLRCCEEGPPAQPLPIQDVAELVRQAVESFL